MNTCLKGWGALGMEPETQMTESLRQAICMVIASRAKRQSALVRLAPMQVTNLMWMEIAAADPLHAGL